MKILLTGCTGQLGAALRDQLKDFAEIIAPTRAQFDLADTAQIANYVQQVQPDLILNPAAYTAVDLAEKESELAYRVNAIAPQLLAEQARLLDIPLIHFSTDYVFDGSKADAQAQLLPYIEDDQCAPLNVYGASKLAGERAIVNSGCKHLILRTSWVYSGVGKNFLLTILRLAKEKSELKIVNDQYGTPSSSYFLSQSCHHILELMTQASDQTAWWKAHQGIYHLTPQGSTNWCDFSRAIVEHAQQLGLLHQLPTIHGIPSAEYPTPARRPRNSCLDKSKAQAHFDLTLPDWEQSLHECLAHIAHYGH